MTDVRKGRRVPDEKRELFKEPFGSPITENDLTKLDKRNKLVTVGDVVSLTAHRCGVTPDVAVYDGMTERREMTEFAELVDNEGWDPVIVKNPAGTITAELSDAVRNALSGHGKTMIRVIGEEDLAVLPCVLLSPIGTYVIYGWPGKGMMLITTDASSIKRTKELMKETEEFE